MHIVKLFRTFAILFLCGVLVWVPTGVAQVPPGPTSPPVSPPTRPSGVEPGKTAPEPATTTEDDDSLFNCRKAKGKFKINFKPETELKDLVTWAFTFTCKNFIYDSKITGRASKVTLMAPDEVSAQQAWKIFLVALQSMGLTIVPKGNVLEIIDHGTAKSSPLPLFMRALPANSDQMVRAVLRPEHLPVDELVKVLTELKSKNGDVKSIPKAGAVLITDFGTHVAKMSSLMLAVDQPLVNERLYLIRIYNGNATDMAQKLEEILGMKSGDGAAAPSPGGSTRRGRDRNITVSAPGSEGGDTESGIESALPSKIVADERTNSLILLGGEAAYQRILALVRRLDVAIGPEGEGRVHVHRLEYANAEELAETLSSIISGTQQPSSAERRARRTATPGAPATPAGGAGGIGADAFEGQVRVTHDTPTNSLVIIASIGDFRSLKEVIKKLDTPRPQVYIEASIVEVRLQSGLDFGTSFHAGKPFQAPVGPDQDSVAVGGFFPGKGINSLSPASLATSSGLVGGIIGPLLDGAVRELLNGQSIPSFGVLFQALSTSSNANILSTPHILTTDNKEAEIAVGTNVPYRSALAGLGGLGIPGAAGAGGASGAAGLAGLLPTQSIQRQDLDLNLKITPHISSEDAVKLEVELVIKDLGESDFQSLGPTWTNKTIKDTVVVADQQSVVLGGLVADRVTIGETKVPLLGDIPLLGYLFKYKTKNKQKTSLLVLLTPYIVRDQADLEKIVKRRVREQREFMESVSSLKNFKYRPEMDYRRKRGLVEEINKYNQVVEEEKALLKAEEDDQLDLPDGPIEYIRDGSKAPPKEAPRIPQPEPEMQILEDEE